MTRYKYFNNLDLTYKLIVLYIAFLLLLSIGTINERL